MKPRMRVRIPASKGSNQCPQEKAFLRPIHISRRFYGIRFHGVISIGASTPILFEQTNWRLRHLQIPTNPATVPLGEGVTVRPRRMQKAPDLVSWPNQGQSSQAWGGGQAGGN
jgi:hypothetical protein